MKASLLVVLLTAQASAFTTTPTTPRWSVTPLEQSRDAHHHNSDTESVTVDRRQWILQSVLAPSSLLSLTSLLANPSASEALVKGNAPPPKTNGSSKPKCTNVEECQAMAEKREQEEVAAMAETAAPSLMTPGGTRYLELAVGQGRTAKAGDDVTITYKVLKLGKRSFDGLSGEGTVVFSRGYALADDEKVPGDKTFLTTLGSPLNVEALNEAVAGMKPGGVRRFSILPPKGWRKPSKTCDGGPGGSGAGGELRTDYVVVPTAQIVQQEDCLDSSKQPFPTSYGEQRRMAQRFDQSLIMEATLMDVADGF
jgi:FKBP-type peptidyl-prolyl cis-trans isomerase